MARFERFFERSLIPETNGDPNGAPHSDPADPGGATQWGLSAVANPLVAKSIVAGKLTKVQARKVYYEKYYAPIVGVNHIDERFAFLLYDTRVHGTVGAVVARVQVFLNRRGASLTVDGIWGPRTLAAYSDLLPSERDQLWHHLRSEATTIGASVARNTMRRQKRQGLPVRDYTNGFTNRIMYAMGDNSNWGA